MDIKNLRGFLAGVALLTLLLSGCENRSASLATTASTSAQPVASGSAREAGLVCYRRVLGRDTTLVRLVISGAAVTGELAVLPVEKDRARGPLRGTLTDTPAGRQIVADWQRSGEGVVQTHEVQFTLAGDSLRWREGARTEKNGKWVLANPGQGYQYVLGKVACAAAR